MKRYTKKELLNAVNSSTSYTQVLKKLGYKLSGGNVWRRIKEEVNTLKLDTSHFNSGRDKLKIFTLDEILVENSTYTNIYYLKIRLVSEKILEYRCDKCGNGGEWNNKILMLQLDHINGIRNDHRKENLRFLCPNCHSQTETFSGRNKKV